MDQNMLSLHRKKMGILWPEFVQDLFVEVGAEEEMKTALTIYFACCMRPSIEKFIFSFD
jgi:hypothetical protein